MDTNSGNNQYDPNYQNNQSYQNSQNYQNNPNNQNSPNNQNGQNYQNGQGYQNNPNVIYSNSQYNGYQNNMANYPYQAAGGGVPTPSNGLQIAGLVCGILAICFSCCSGIPGIILGIVGIICAVNGNKESKNGMGTAGLVCSIIGLILGMLMLIYFVVVYKAAFEELLDIGNGYTFY